MSEAAANPPAMKPGWGECPPADLPLRQTVPAFRPETACRLLRFACGQPAAALTWVCDRAEHGYFNRGEKDSTRCSVVAALDLLRWQTSAATDLVALSKLPTDMEMFWTKPEQVKPCSTVN